MDKKACHFKMIGNVQIWAKWQIVIPKEARDTLNLKTWDELVVIIHDGQSIGLIKNENLMEFITEIQAFIKNFNS